MLPELLGKWYTCKQCPKVQSTSFSAQTEEEDSRTWCYCRKEKGGEMIGCDGKSCGITWFRLDCVGILLLLFLVANGYVPHAMQRT